MKLVLTFCAVLFASGCVVSDPESLGHDERFAGNWLVAETTAHATSFATTWSFSATGSLDVAWDGSMPAGPFGWVTSDSDDPVTCHFGTYWYSVGPEQLVVEGLCTDDINREIELQFPSDTSGNQGGVDIDIDSVGGEGGWLAPAWGWEFIRCPDGDVCTSY